MTASGIEGMRAEIERIDHELISLIAKRMGLARDLGRVKRDAGLPTLDPTREAAVVRRAGETARSAGLPEEPVREIFWHIIGLSRRAQTPEAS